MEKINAYPVLANICGRFTKADDDDEKEVKFTMALLDYMAMVVIAGGSVMKLVFCPSFQLRCQRDKPKVVHLLSPLCPFA